MMPQEVHISLDGTATGTHLLGRPTYLAEGTVHVALLPNSTNAGRSVVFLSGVSTVGAGVIVQLTANNFLNAASAIRGRLLATGELAPEVNAEGRVDPLTFVLEGGTKMPGRVLLMHDNLPGAHVYTPDVARLLARELCKAADAADGGDGS